MKDENSLYTFMQIRERFDQQIDEERKNNARE
jgi:hypothetical protein